MLCVMKPYKHIFFDLDHTLWDFETNSKSTLLEIFETCALRQRGIFNFDQFYQTYQPINDQYWYLYHNHKVTKEELRLGRFRETLSRFNIEDESLVAHIADMYVTQSPHRQALFPHAHEMLTYLSGRYQLHIITNGFKEVQQQKILHSGLQPYFTHTVVSEEVGFQKPSAAIFEHTVKITASQKHECLMVGDNIQTDIDGAMNAGIDAVLFNPKRKWHKAKPTFEVHCLSELSSLL